MSRHNLLASELLIRGRRLAVYHVHRWLSYYKGTCYIISGCAGAGMSDMKPGKWWTAFAKAKTYHACRVSVTRLRLTVQAIDTSGKVFDQVVLEK